MLNGCWQDWRDPPDDEQQACSKHVEVYYWNKLIENSASHRFILYGYTRDYNLPQSKYQVLGIMAYPNQNTTYQGSSSSSQPWSFFRQTWHWTRSRSSFEPQKMNPASASCKRTRNYTHHSAEVCLSGRNRLHIYMVEKSVTICTIYHTLIMTHTLLHFPRIQPCGLLYRSAGKSLPRPGRKQATATEDFEFHISYL